MARWSHPFLTLPRGHVLLGLRLVGNDRRSVGLAAVRADPNFHGILTPRLRLRRSEPGDAETISRYRSDPAVHVHQGWDRTDPEGVRTEIEEMGARVPGEPGGWVQFSLEERETGRLVGDVGLSARADEPGVMLVGYTVAPEAQGHGYATEAVSALVDYAFATLDAGLIRAYADAGNTASIRVMEKVGMRLMERFEGHDEDGDWFGVRYERPRAAS
jgi:RimJ/RimL family protein N-acetyltransferase